MSILIKGMEVPTCCSLCPCFNDEYYYCQAANMDLRRIQVESRHPNCPLIEVPEDVQPVKHGRWAANIFCSNCGWYMEDDVTLSPMMVFFNYCPNCGADMREEDDGDIA